MMDWTDRNCRSFHRSLSARSLLYSEMVTVDAILYGDRDRLLGYDPVEHPVALQIGGSDPEAISRAVRIARDWGYDEFNLNVGCPSERVQAGAFGACLMREPALVADCLAAMIEASDRPVTVKHRLGVDDDDPRQSLFSFVETVARAGVKVFIVHARKAWLRGLSPKENREIPPLDYDLVADLKSAYPDLTIILNGGLMSLGDCRRELGRFDGVMVGRAAYQSPALLLDVDREIFGLDAPVRTPIEAAEDFRETVVRRLEGGVPLHAMTRHMLGLFASRPGARRWRRILSEQAPGARGRDAILIYDEALRAMRGPTLGPF
jgi:tRNA-dihydrouridine synthase A